MPDIIIDVSVRCAGCGEGLSGKTIIKDHGGVKILHVGVCPKCMDFVYRKAFGEGVACNNKKAMRELIESIMRYKGIVGCPGCSSPDPDKHAEGCPVAALYPEE